MANKTMDRKKAAPARPQAGRNSLKSAGAKTPRPSVTKDTTQSDLKQEKATSGADAEVLEADDLEAEEVAVDEEAETEEAEGEEVDNEEALKEEKPASRRAKKERDLVATNPPDYSVSRSATGGSRLPKNAFVRFVQSSYRELRLVTWPSRRDTWNWSLVVVGVCIAVAILLGLADLGLTRFVNWWLSLAQ